MGCWLDRLEFPTRHFGHIGGAAGVVPEAQVSRRRKRARSWDTEDARPAGRLFEHIPARVVSAFEDVLQHTLSAWHVPGVDHATYDQHSGEVRAGGRTSAGRGKGGALRAAFRRSQ